MSYDIELRHADGKICGVPRFQEGGTQPVGGTTEAHLNITYNYSYFFENELDKKRGIRFLYEKPAADVIDLLTAAVERLGVRQDDDYWKETPGNAGYALNILLGWAKLHLDAVFEGD